MKLPHCFTPLALAIGALALAGAAHAADTIKIGIPQPMTGPNTQYGDQIQAGALTAIETINAKGGVKGKKLEPILIDDGCEPKQAVPAANRVVNSGAKFAVAHACSGVTVPAVNIYEQEGIVAITPGATSPLVTDTIKPHYFFRTIGRDDQQGPFAARYIANTVKPKKVAVLHDKQTYGSGVASQVKDALERNKVNVALYEGINVGDSDYSAIITKLKAAGVDFVYFGGYHPELGLLLRQSREQGLNVQFMGPEGTANQDLVAIAGPAIDGLLVTLPSDFTKLPGNEGIVKAFKDAKRDPDGAFQMPAYAAVQVLADSINAVGEDPAKVADYMHKSAFDTSIGKVEFDAKGDLKDFEFAVFKWDKNGKKTQL
ncbi:branched-chain amino acid ABC transporter substrate-binding protein [Bordetella avium]|uniref:High-affinity branched-chain amino acid ABC transporter, leu/ile/val-binding protein n=1 Tax=Bordetella avium (strain 197N) TaxID=360910 RepID=Q2L0I9_BORA1|nr:branched-chain amino acid ABC transporter substrate-binding protein [Bordetella avium]AZY49239.1 branched-chain amino acid ABC transporter substrate-binding protein [Bordetella avium]AZY52596.1 branched-chain amino acid ABC transporter substrate-binding protein [Bordetella avium]RIQ12720.1 branched-chain amino acid ABC transporter substrate-binding protein [Bordetella avium]RIQ19243.1 branched-chain amino acid ABC transporter substrate-binding protein [Bordetella avium]RIQ33410.1 branched-c